MVALGTLSYSLYLWQQPWVHMGGGTVVWQSFPLNVALAFLCAVLSYTLIERPFLRLRDRRRAA
jgi:peptidoglycan/LPS O-acetylase OafA/YrhL